MLLPTSGALRAPVRASWAQSKPASVGRQHVLRIPKPAQAAQAVQELFELSVLAPSALQEVLVGGAVVSAVSAALYNGFKKEPQVCDQCKGAGGTGCFGCEGSGRMELLPHASSVKASQRRDVLGRTIDARACRVCKGDKLILCQKCRGSGFTSF